jgi:hypothetical protein
MTPLSLPSIAENTKIINGEDKSGVLRRDETPLLQGYRF